MAGKRKLLIIGMVLVMFDNIMTLYDDSVSLIIYTRVRLAKW